MYDMCTHMHPKKKKRQKASHFQLLSSILYLKKKLKLQSMSEVLDYRFVQYFKCLQNEWFLMIEAFV